MRFRVGDIVRISSQSDRNGEGRDNPRNFSGIVERIDNDSLLQIKVRWDEFIYNYYDEKDLKLVRRA